MTRKDYIALAQQLAAVRPSKPAMLRQWQLDCNALVPVLARDNSRFDAARFLAACAART